MTLFAGFDRIRIINLPSRPDRRREMESELGKIGLGDDQRVRFVDGVTVDDKAPFRAGGEKGVFLAQLGIISEAAAADESVLILEDDIDFTAAAMNWCLPDGCDIVYGGYEASDPNDLQSSDIVGAHCMGFSARAARALAPFLQGLLRHESPPPIDGAYVWFRRQHPDFRTEFAKPVIAVQRPSRSDIAAPKAFDRIPLLRGPVGTARRIKRKFQRGDVTFGLPEALLFAITGVTIAALAAYHYTH
jgi:glycosyl transferase family 25